MTNASVATASSASFDLLQDLIAKAWRKGADSADAILVDSSSVSLDYRMGRVETTERAESGDLDLRVFVGKQQAMVSTSDRSPKALDELVERAVAMAKAAPEDPFCGLASPEQIARKWPELDLADNAPEPSMERLIETARAMEESALAVKGVTNSEGAGAGYGKSRSWLVASNGFSGSNESTSTTLGVSVIAGTGTGMERDYEHESRIYASDLPSPADIGRKAGECAARRLGARKMPTCQVPVVFDPRIGGALLGALSGAISGAAVARGTTFLKDNLDTAIFPETVTITDDPFMPRGARSCQFDAEGILPMRRAIVEKGVLKTWLLDLRSARQLGIAQSTGHASRAPGGTPSPSPSNLYLEAGRQTPQELIRDIRQGFYVTELMGSGVSIVTGDYSHAAAGFWIENGEIAFPVNEMTIASNLRDMFAHLSAANDLVFTRGVNVPTLRIEQMTVAGL